VADLPIIFPEDVTPVLARMQASLEKALGRTLAPADVEVLILNSFAYELQLQRMAANQAFRQNLVDFAAAPMLDYLGALVGVVREPATGAECVIRFNFVSGANALLLPAGIRMQSVDGQVIFETVEAVNVAAGTATVDVDAICATAGAAGNGYAAGNVSVILDPQPYVSSAGNLDTTSGGNDAETDDQLRARIKIAPSAFSVAGPNEAYEFWAKSTDPSIVDVKCVTTAPGEVTLYPLCNGGTLASSALKDKILATCSGTKVRPQNDTVLVADPSVISYTIDVTLTLYTDAVPADVLAQVNANLAAFAQPRVNKLGLDIVIAQIVGQCMIPGKVYNVTVNSPTVNTVADDSTYTDCTGIIVAIGGTANG
jgi:phage-related baseplate assembly protein